MLHYRKTKLTYNRHRTNDQTLTVCAFCDIANEHIVAENDTMFVIPNRVSYDMFEGRRVVDHVMVIPKLHRESTAEFTAAERSDVMLLIGEYESKGYNVYMRGVDSPSRSVKHQHTHLIKLRTKSSQFVLYAHKPYILIDF